MLVRDASVSVALCLWTLSASAQPLTFSRDDVASRAGARAIVSADFDGNGWPDIAHANTGRNTVTVLLNHAGGRDGLAVAYDIAVGTGPFDLVAADFNRDSVPDLAVANADNDTITVLFGARGRGFPTRTTIAAPGNPRGIAAADMNRDGNIDIVYTAYLQREARVVLGNGSGGFGAAAWKTYSVWCPQGVALADFNHDGWIDVAVASVSNLGLDIFYGSESTGGYGATQFNTPSQNVVAAGDFNNDGELDLAAASSTTNRLTVYLGPSYTSQATYATGASPRGILTADLNADGLLDLVTGNRTDGNVSVLVGTGGGAFAAAMNVPSGSGSRGVVAADFDHDGQLDLATGNELAATTTLLSNQTMMVPAARAFDRVALDASVPMFPLAVADFNHNGRVDVVLPGRVLLDGTTSVALPGRPEQMAAVGDFNRDGHLDIARSDYYNNTISVLLGDGAGGFTPGWQVPFDGYSIFAVDMNRDGATDLIVSGATGNGTHIARYYRGNGDGTFAAANDMPLQDGSLNIDVTDVDRDGKLDIVIPHSSSSGSSSTVIVFLGDGLGSYSRAEAHVVGAGFGDVKVADVNEDGRNDLVVGVNDAVSTDIAILFGRSDGGFDPPVRYPSTAIPGRSASVYHLDVADVNHDGHVDIVYQSLLLGRGNGMFDLAEFELGSGHPLFVDDNRDGTTDIINSDGEGISVLLNLRTESNRPPVGIEAGADRHYLYLDLFTEDDCCEIFVQGSDPDQHALKYEWRTTSGTLAGYGREFVPRSLGSGTHHLVLTVTDGRGGQATDTVTVTIDPYVEIVAYAGLAECCGAWIDVSDSTAAAGTRKHHPNANAPKLETPLANPQNYIERQFVADPSQVYKLWIRMKAQDNSWANDSVFVQFSGAVDQAGNAYAIGTTSGLAVNLEQCSSGCGVAGWGWRDERWGPTLNGAPVLLRFPNGGWQTIRIQTREDGVSIDEFTLSGQQFKSAPPGPPKNDTHILFDTTGR